MRTTQWEWYYACSACYCRWTAGVDDWCTAGARDRRATAGRVFGGGVSDVYASCRRGTYAHPSAFGCGGVFGLRLSS